MTTRHHAALGALTVAALTSALLTVPAAARSAADADGQLRIHDLQGSTRLSPYADRTVREVPGIVTGVRGYGSKGFWIQDPRGDGSAATSEGIFVFTGSGPAPGVRVGDSVLVSGKVGEYYYGGSGSGNQSVTQISGPEVTVVSSGHRLPRPEKLHADRIPEAYTPPGDPAQEDGIEGLALRPERYALDLYESLEGMNVQVPDARVVGPSTPYGELWVTVKPRQERTVRGGTRYSSYDAQNSGRLKIETLTPLSEEPFPATDTGDRLTGGAAGPLDYDQFGGYNLAARETVTVERRELPQERTRAQRRGELAVATYNVENLDPGDDPAKFQRLADGVVENLASPDILALEEIQDDTGARNDGTVTAGKTVSKLIDAIAAAGGPRYEWRGIAPQDGQDGGQPGGNIRNVFLFNPERVSFTDRPGGDATTATGVTEQRGRAALTHSPGRVTPEDAAWEDSRKPLAGEFRFRGRPVIVVANHFASKGGDQPLHGRVQPPQRSSEKQRLRQATQVNTFVKEVLAVQRKAKVVVLGDINDFEFSPTTQALTDGHALRSTVRSLPRDERYTYVFQGNAQVLDQTLVSPGIRRFDYDIVHTNAEFADQVSDHDPQVLRFRP
ncbi:endonuclease/exonuclease/phosphatase family protein [Streptomyces sp. N2-109]|uniref:Endonuclease/exonuclease/phosphatase family protein n=1 Tax=Streptomyces gossypii TaxID=2883101 RepID=A0ABT2K0X5_9ACTN|nr:endonuclease/exonuclease/phosphatase family protein [Streptomyces gossypii]MCT2593818.1 endonuclease/exonuclease/phosphatase family protein [Streptomyces gossypii]